MVRTLAELLWFPALLFAGFLFFFAPALHAPAPHHVKVAVSGPGAARQIARVLDEKRPDGFDVRAVPDADAARQAVLDRDAVGAYAADPAHPTLYVAKANGKSLEQALSEVFGNIATKQGKRLTVTDVAPTASGDAMGSSLLYYGIAWSIPGYVLATTLLRAVTLGRRGKILVILGVAAAFSVLGFYAGVAMDILPNDPAAIPIGFLMTAGVAMGATGLAPFVKQFFPGVAMTLFIVMSIPTSGGAVPVPLLPPFFQAVHLAMPLGNGLDALRGILYFDGAGVLRPVLVLCAWIAGGAALMGLFAWRQRRATVRSAVLDDDGTGADEFDEGEAVEEPPVDDPALEMPTPTALPVHEHHFGEPVPMLVGRVHDAQDEPFAGAAVTVMDSRGRQLVRTTTNRNGEYAATGLPEGYLSVVISAAGRNPVVHQTLLRPGATARADFALHGRRDRESRLLHGTSVHQGTVIR
ncbi:putative integral membrane protein [Streptomyces bingchenggensis BCW-1]|uniref:Putative integral membrane protein n=1 Tax=Streptomyces bingchenggensis (strain BCW-1) TaxID=749414 RepID=D7C4U1_STRBB|nr:putative integral membrane protein [Streptomyces bingchenggensis BCW-1]